MNELTVTASAHLNELDEMEVMLARLSSGEWTLQLRNKGRFGGVSLFVTDDQLKQIAEMTAEHLGFILVEPNKGDGK